MGAAMPSSSYRSPVMKPALLVAYNLFCVSVLGLIGLSSLSMLSS